MAKLTELRDAVDGRTEKVQTMLTTDEADALREEAAARTVKEKRRVSMSDVLRDLVQRWLAKRGK